MNLAKTSLIKFAQAAQSNPVRNAIEVNQWKLCKVTLYQAALTSMEALENQFKLCIKATIPITTIPANCPDEYNPKMTEHKKMRVFLEKEFAQKLARAAGNIHATSRNSDRDSNAFDDHR